MDALWIIDDHWEKAALPTLELLPTLDFALNPAD